MADGQTGLMQQVVDRPAANIAGLFGAFPANPPILQPPGVAHTCETGVIQDKLCRIVARHVGRSTHQMLDEPAVHEFAALLLPHKAQDAFENSIANLLVRGPSIEHIYLRLFQPAARHLGELWAEDICSFVDVTLAMTRLQSGLRRLAPQFQRQGRAADGTRSVIFASLRGDQHTFGLSMLAEFFRRSGWAVRCVGPGESAELTDGLGTQRGAVVGFSVSRIDQLPELKATIRYLRSSHGSRLAGIMVGGPLFATHPEYARDLGADAVGLDARHALAQAERLAAIAEECR